MNDPDDRSPPGNIEKEAADWLSRLRGEDALDRDAFETWYATSEAHAESFDRALAAWEASSLLSVAPTIASPDRWRHVALSLAIAASLFLVVGGIVRFWPAGPAAHMVAVQTKTGEVRTIALADGSRVTLDTASAIHANLTPERREIDLVRGRGRFEVRGDPRPFIVRTPGGSVEATDASFDVGLDGARSSVGLLRGHVTVQSGFQRASFSELDAGQKTSFAGNAAPTPVERYSDGEARWTSGMLAFDDRPLGEVLVDVNRYNRKQIALADPVLGGLRFTGAIKPSSPDAFARMLAAMYGLDLAAPAPDRLVLSRHP